MKHFLVLMFIFFYAGLGVSAPAVQLTHAKGRVVNLGSAVLIRVIEGQLLVENVASNKQLWIHYSLDHGPWQKLAAYYVGKDGPSGLENWNFSINADAIPYQNGQYQALNVEFAIELVSESGSVWDNNGAFDRNYRVSSPGLQPEYARIDLGSTALMLESAQFRNEPWPAYANSFSGSLILKNISYQKKVLIHYSTDDWQSVQTVPAVYSQSAGVTTERWYFYTLLGKNSSKPLSFYVSYETAGHSYFDSHWGDNYRIGLDGVIDLN